MEVKRKSLWRGSWETIQNPWIATILNLTLANGAYIANKYIQVFCQPVLWATIVLIVSFIPVVFWPLIKHYQPKFIPLAQFFRGIAFCICLYCIVFLEDNNFMLPILAFFGIGILGMAPHLFAIQIIIHLVINRKHRIGLLSFAMGILFSLIGAGYFIQDFHASSAILRSMASSPTAYDGSHSAGVERIAGMHFKYHTRILAGIDGWRPPLHDPALIIGLWSSGWSDPLDMRLDKRIAYYRQLFPEKSVMTDCACANNFDGLSYFSSGYWKEE